MDHRTGGASAHDRKLLAPVVSAVKHGDLLAWLIAGGHDQTDKQAEARVSRWTHDRVLEQVMYM